MLTVEQQKIADGLRTQGFGDRKIARELGVTRWQVRRDRELRLQGFEPEQAAAEGKVPGFQHVVLVSDTQHPFAQDEAACESVMEFLADTKPDRVIQVGDFIDFYTISSYPKRMPLSSRPSLKDEVDATRGWLQRWHSTTPDSEWIVLEGNHELRLKTYVEKYADQLTDFDELSVPSLLGFHELGIRYIEPYGEGLWAGRAGGLWVTHGNYARKHSGWSARAHLEATGFSVAHGHTHRLGSFFVTNMTGTYGGFEVGCLCVPERTPPFDRLQNWQLGFASVWVSTDSPRFHVDLIAITDGGFVANGKKYGR